jgi:hypothetical protein
MFSQKTFKNDESKYIQQDVLLKSLPMVTRFTDKMEIV